MSSRECWIKSSSPDAKCRLNILSFLTYTSTSIRLPHLNHGYHDHWFVTANDGKGWKGSWCARGLIDVRACIRGLGVGIKFSCCAVVNPYCCFCFFLPFLFDSGSVN